jgi:hypothetical protein
MRVKQKRLARLRCEDGVKLDLFTSNFEMKDSGADSRERPNGSTSCEIQRRMRRTPKYS